MKKKRYNDEELIEGLRQGDDAVLNFLYKNYYGVVLGMILKSYGNEDHARDIFQEVIIIIYSRLQDDDFKITSSFFTFFYAVIKNTWSDYRRLGWKNPLFYAKDYKDEIGVGIEIDQVEALSAEALRLVLFNKHLKELAKSCQQILNLLIAEYIPEEIANELGFKSANYVNKRKSECLKILIEKIRNDEIYKKLNE